MRRLLPPVLAPFVVLTMLLAGSFAWVAPAGAAPHSSSRAVRASGQEVGDTVALLSVGGDEEGSFTITDLTDDFQDTDEEPLRGQRTVSLDVEIEADGGDISVDPEGFNLVDSTGFAWIDVPITRTDDKESLEATELADGDSIAGSLEIIIPEDVDITKVLYLVDDERILTLLDFTSGLEAGDVVTLFDEEAEESGTIVADEVFEDFQDVESSSDPGRGFVLYGVAVTVENTGAEPLSVGQGDFRAVDVNGVVWAPDPSLERTEESLDEIPDLESGDVDPGDEISGFVGFVVYADIAIDYVAYVPDVRFYPVIDNVGSPGGDDASPVAGDDATPVADDGSDGQTDDESPVADDADCAGVADWSDASLDNVAAWSEALDSITPTSDSEELRALATDVEAIAEAQADIDPPVAAEELSDLLVEAYEDTVDALNDAADGLDQGDDALTEEAAAEIEEIGDSFDSGGEVYDAIEDLAAACPGEIDA